MQLASKQRPELWAGVECTRNRIGDTWFDQMDRNGHRHRPEDLERFARLGIARIRYPVLWEHIAPHGLATADWTWADERLNRLRELGIDPIVGFVHHGSGPAGTSLVEESFVKGLTAYAAAFAQRYPWVQYYTPVNEPLTTARFSGLYGHWYPHGRDGATFTRALLIQCRAVVEAMRAVRAVNPAAQLVQTEDLGKVFSTPFLAHQADLENERRWLTFDLLTGQLTSERPMWSYLRSLGAATADLAWFEQNPCPPDILGINHYLTSERFLDENLTPYPSWAIGGNLDSAYADLEAVRVRNEGAAGPYALLRETWERYHQPLAVTEAHLCCTREEQMRWLYEVWQAGVKLKNEGVDIKAITAWSLLGTYDWDSLVTQANGHYEPGIFDVRAPQPRPTALAHLLKQLATGSPTVHPVLATAGWWRRPVRLLYPPVQSMGSVRQADTELPSSQPTGASFSSSDLLRAGSPAFFIARHLHSAGPEADPFAAETQPLLILGKNGTLGRAFSRLCALRGLACRVLSRQELDLTNPGAVERILAQWQPWAVINAAGYVRVDQAEHEPALCYQVNTEGPARLAAACQQAGIPLLTFSSDLVFDGKKSEPYRESDAVNPLNVYGRSKALAEEKVLTACAKALVIRTSAFFGPWDSYNFVFAALQALEAGQPFLAASDVHISPTYVPDLVHTSLDLLLDGETGLWHLANAGQTTWAQLAQAVAEQFQLNPHSLVGRPLAQLGPLPAARPHYSVLGSERGWLMPSFTHALVRYQHELERALVNA